MRIKIGIKLITYRRVYGYMNRTKWWYVSVIVLAWAGAFDLATTVIGIGHFGLVETNVLAQSVLAPFGMLGLVVLKLAVISAFVSTNAFVTKYSYRIAIYQNICLTVIWLLASLNNTLLIASLT